MILADMIVTDDEIPRLTGWVVPVLFLTASIILVGLRAARRMIPIRIRK